MAYTHTLMLATYFLGLFDWIQDSMCRERVGML
jgi:hypothetical protein